MSQAEKLNTTNRLSSRRRFLAVLSAGAASAVAPAALAAPLMPVTASEVDPIFAVIAEHRAVFRAWMDALQAEDRAAESAGIRGEDAAIRIVLTAQPTTIEGVAALLHHVGQHECLGMDSEYEEDRETVLTTWNNLEDERKRIAQDFPLRLAATVRTMAGTTTPRRIEPTALPAGAGEVDPIFAAIERYKTAVRERAVVLAAEDACDAEWDDKDRDACDAEWEAFDGLFETPAISIAGIAALLELLGTDPYSEAEYGPGESVLGWAYNNGPGSPSERAANRLMSTLAGALRTMRAQAIGGQS